MGKRARKRTSTAASRPPRAAVPATAAAPLEPAGQRATSGPFGHLYTEAATLERIADHASRVAELEADIRADVGFLRETGVSWATIGRALGITGQAAGQRYRDRSPVQGPGQ